VALQQRNATQKKQSRDLPNRKSYAQTAAQPAKPQGLSQVSSAMLTPETVQLASVLCNAVPDMTIERALELVTCNRPIEANQPQPKGRKSVMAAKVAQSISQGHSRKAVQFAFSDIIRPEHFSDMGIIVDEINKHLVYARSSVRIQNGRLYKKVVHFYLNKVPTQPEFDRFKECLFKALKTDVPEGNEDSPFAPQSVAHLILKGFEYYTNKYNRRPEDILTGDQVMEKMQNIDQFRGLDCVKKPSVVKCRGSNDMAVVFLDVWDSKNGIRTKELVNKVYHIGGKLIRVEYARQREFVPQCQKCWSWTHGTSRCRINHQWCARCGGPHKTENHNEFSTCCGELRKKGEFKGTCEHTVRCLNCKGAHTADSFKCVYKKHQNDISWHDRRREADMKEHKEKRERRKANITQALQNESRIIEVLDSQ
jgi:hypothetical protein